MAFHQGWPFKDNGSKRSPTKDGIFFFISELLHWK